MTSHDPELELFRTEVSCAALLERSSPAWQLDKRESTRRALKYRRGAGEIVIVNHDERGWWDPLSTAKGDVFDLAQHLEPGLNFGQVRVMLRRFVGVSPSYPEALRTAKQTAGDQSVAERWARKPRLRPGSDAWCYLAGQRCLPAFVLRTAAEQDAVRQGAYRTAWFAHRQDGADSIISHVEIRGPDYKGSLNGGCKTLFRFGRIGQGVSRLAVTEAPIDAMSLAAIENLRPDTIYVATGGGMGPGSISAIEAALLAIAIHPDALLVSGADANKAGDIYGQRHACLAATVGVRFERLRPPEGLDWNDVLKGRGS